MPVVTIGYEDLVGLLGTDPGIDRLREVIPSIGSDLVRIDKKEIEVEFFPNRPDLYSVEGLARALRCYLGMEEPRGFSITPSGFKLFVEDSVKCVRPYMVAGIARQIVFDDLLITSIMQAQEKLHGTLGRGRKKVAIGVHDLSRVKPPFYYRGVKDATFIPLGWGRELSLKAILKEHEKGRDYAYILEGAEAFPLLVDSTENVLSFPPIINSNTTEVTENTTDILLDVTGTDRKAVEDVLKILMTLFAERGAKLESVDIVDGEESRSTPDLKPQTMSVELKYVNDLLGLDLSSDAAALLAKMGYSASLEKGTLSIRIPPYRADILHPVDIVEDMAIAYGYQNFAPALPDVFTPGMEREETRKERRLRQFMAGLGFIEVVTFTLTGLEDQYGKMRLEEEAGHIVNPLTTQTNSLRTWMLPSLMQILSLNKHRDLPQKIFEIDDVVLGGENETRLAAAITSSRTGFTEIKGNVQALMEGLGKEITISPEDHPSFIPGRCAAIEVSGEKVGFFGEVHPEVITNFGLGYPVTAFEINLEKTTMLR